MPSAQPDARPEATKVRRDALVLVTRMSSPPWDSCCSTIEQTAFGGAPRLRRSRVAQLNGREKIFLTPAASPASPDGAKRNPGRPRKRHRPPRIAQPKAVAPYRLPAQPRSIPRKLQSHLAVTGGIVGPAFTHLHEQEEMHRLLDQACD